MIFLFFILAAICNAVMDTLSHHFETSIFYKEDPKFWNPNVSWKYAKYLPLTKYKLDAWHLAKSGMIVFAIAGGVSPTITYWWLDFIICGLLWNGTFNLFYNKFL